MNVIWRSPFGGLVTQLKWSEITAWSEHCNRRSLLAKCWLKYNCILINANWFVPHVLVSAIWNWPSYKDIFPFPFPFPFPLARLEYPCPWIMEHPHECKCKCKYKYKYKYKCKYICRAVSSYLCAWVCLCVRVKGHTFSCQMDKLSTTHARPRTHTHSGNRTHMQIRGLGNQLSFVKLFGIWSAVGKWLALGGNGWKWLPLHR